MNLRHWTLAVGAAAAIAVTGMSGEASATVSPLPPHITATPSTLAAGQTTELHGIGFSPRTTLTVEECSEPTFPVTGTLQRYCDLTGSIKVTTSAAGTFSHAFVAQRCPQLAIPVEETCYIGVPKPVGVDEITLLGAAKITVG